MSPLDTVKRLVDDEPCVYDEADHRTICVHCTAEGIGHAMPVAHEPGCLWLALPAVVAVLEALGPLTRYLRHHNDCDVPQRLSPVCTCGLAEVLRRAYPDILAGVR